MRKSWLTLAGTSLVAALSAWLAAGALAVVDLSVVPRRVGLLPSWWWIPVTGGALAALLAWRGRVARAPWLTAGLLVLPWLPVWVPPAFLIWTGPMAAWVWCGTLAAVAIASWPDEWSSSPFVRTWLVAPGRGAWVAFAVALTCYLAGARLVSTVLPAGDEPHYLVITQSLLKDGDLKIENNHRQEDYVQYFRGMLKPDYLRRGQDGEIYSIHAPGVSAIVLPAFALGGYPGVIVFLAFVSALGTWLVWRTAFLLTQSAGAAWFGWSVAALGAPLFFHAFTVYPDGIGAVVVMSGVYSLVRLEVAREAGGAPAPRAWWGLQGLLLAILPWLHTRYAGAAAVLGLCLVLRLLGRRDYRAVVGLATAPVLSAAAWFGYFHAIYGEFNPAAPYGDYTQTSAGNIPRGLVGLFFDQQFGIIPNAPACAPALAGLWVIARRRLRIGLELAAVFFSYLALVAAYHMWWGGWSAPARFAVPVLLMLGVPAAAWWQTRGAAGKAVGGVALAVTLLVTASLVLAQDGALIFNDRDGFGRWLEWVSPLVDLPRAFPSFFRVTPWGVAGRAAVWAIVLLGAAWLLGRISPADGAPGPCRRRLAWAAPLVFAGALMAGASAMWGGDSVAAVTPTTAQLALLRAVDPAVRPVGVQFKPLRLAGPGEIVTKLQLSNSRRRTLPDDYPMLLLANVPAGTYRLGGSALASLRGVVEISIGRSPQPIARWDFDETPRRPQSLLRLPSAVDAVVITGDARARESARGGLSIQPVAVVPPGEEVVAWRASRAATYGSLTVFTASDAVYLEDPGLWVAGGVDTPLAIGVDGAAASWPLLVRNGTNANVVHLRAGAWSERVELQPREERVVALPGAAARGMMRLDVRAEKGFRPADVEPASRDLRFLGVWLQPLPPQNLTTPAR